MPIDLVASCKINFWLKIMLTLTPAFLLQIQQIFLSLFQIYLDKSHYYRMLGNFCCLHYSLYHTYAHTRRVVLHVQERAKPSSITSKVWWGKGLNFSFSCLFLSLSIALLLFLLHYTYTMAYHHRHCRHNSTQGLLYINILQIHSISTWEHYKNVLRDLCGTSACRSCNFPELIHT